MADPLTLDRNEAVARELHARMTVLNRVPAACVRTWPEPTPDGDWPAIAIAVHPDYTGRLDLWPIPVEHAGHRVVERAWIGGKAAWCRNTRILTSSCYRSLPRCRWRRGIPTSDRRLLAPRSRRRLPRCSRARDRPCMMPRKLPGCGHTICARR